MRRLAALVDALEASLTGAGVDAALTHYFEQAPAADAAWALFLLAGGRLPLRLPAALLRRTACKSAGVDEWLFDASLQAAGDLAETIAHLLPPPTHASGHGLAYWVEQRLLPWRGLAAEEQAAQLHQAFDELTPPERYVLVKLVGGGWRVGVGRLQLQRTLARQAGVASSCMAQRLAGWTDERGTVDGGRYLRLLAPESPVEAGRRPLAFSLAQALSSGLAAALPSPLDHWLVEWQFNGLRAQLVCRDGLCWIWSRDDDLLNKRVPELTTAARALPAGTVLDGELLVWPSGRSVPASFQQLQARMARQTLSRRQLAEQAVVFVAFDLLQWQGQDQRALPQHERRRRLQALFDTLPPANDAPLRLSPRLLADDGLALTALHGQARSRGARGLMLKRQDAAYASPGAEAVGPWWAWPIAPLTVSAVLIYAQAGSGRPGEPGGAYSLGLWNRPPIDAAEVQAVVEAMAAGRPATPGTLQLLPVAKVSMGLGEAEQAVVELAVREHTLQRFGPVRSLRPTLVLKLAFEGADPSPRHNCGLVLRRPRLLGLRLDLAPHQADSLPALQTTDFKA